MPSFPKSKAETTRAEKVAAIFERCANELEEVMKSTPIGSEYQRAARAIRILRAPAGQLPNVTAWRQRRKAKPTRDPS